AGSHVVQPHAVHFREFALHDGISPCAYCAEAACAPAAAIILAMFCGAKNSGSEIVPAKVPKKFSISAWLPRIAENSCCMSGVGGCKAAIWQVKAYIAITRWLRRCSYSAIASESSRRPEN